MHSYNQTTTKKINRGGWDCAGAGKLREIPAESSLDHGSYRLAKELHS